MSQINTRIVLRNDTKANWEGVGARAKLMVGEIGIETDTGLFKIGRENDEGGLCTWAELPYANDIPEIDLTSVTNNVKVEATLAALGNGNVVGDMGIVKAPLYEGASEYTYTAYVWNGTAWAAMDGNYSAANVFTNAKITLAGDYGLDSRKDKITSIGNLRIGDEIAAGTSLQSILMDMLSQRLQPGNATAPSVSWETNPTGTKEVGTKVTPSYKAKLNPGSYTYGPDTGITANSWSVSIADTGETAKTARDGSFNEITIKDGMSGYGKVTATATYDAGATPVDNLGDTATNAATVQIPAGSKSATAIGYTGYRAWFCGYKAGGATLNVDALTSAQIRALGNAANGSFLGSMTTDKMQQMFFAAPAGLVDSISIRNAANDAPQPVKKISTYVKGVNDYVVTAAEATATNTTYGMLYDIFYVSNDNAESGKTTFTITTTLKA